MKGPTNPSNILPSPKVIDEIGSQEEVAHYSLEGKRERSPLKPLHDVVLTPERYTLNVES